MKTSFNSKFKIDWKKSQLVFSTSDETVILTIPRYDAENNFGGVVVHTNEKRSGLKVGELIEYAPKNDFALFKGNVELEND